MREYTRFDTFVNNLPYAVMVLLGSTAIALGLGMSVPALIAAGAYLGYGIVGAVWIMIFVCPHCNYYATRGCPCGYGTVSARLVGRGAADCFDEKFKRHIPAIVPLWFIPLGVGGAVLARGFSWTLVGFLAAFALDGFLVLPLVSTKHGCTECPQRDECPWMKSRRAESPAPPGEVAEK